MKIAKSGASENLKMNMMPMIDVCFQLLIFFMLSLRLYSLEGDFSIKMPLSLPQEGLPDEAQMPPVRVRILADADGNLALMEMGQRKVVAFADLQHQIREVSGLDRGPAGTPTASEVEIDCDYNLKFKYVIKALTAITGYVDDDKTIIHMIDKIKFAPPRKPEESSE